MGKANKVINKLTFDTSARSYNYEALAEFWSPEYYS